MPRNKLKIRGPSKVHKIKSQLNFTKITAVRAHREWWLHISLMGCMLTVLNI
jgi:hypothetical protein